MPPWRRLLSGRTEPDAGWRVTHALLAQVEDLLVSMTPHPTQLELRDDKLRITWSDGVSREYALRELREQCPCATCRERRAQPPASTLELTILTPAEIQPLRLIEMKPVGNYAYHLGFSDGHNTGIYTLEFLRELGQPVR